MTRSRVPWLVAGLCALAALLAAGCPKPPAPLPGGLPPEYEMPRGYDPPPTPVSPGAPPEPPAAEPPVAPAPAPER